MSDELAGEQQGQHKHGNDKFMASVKLGPKGQIVIPKEVRVMFGVEPGDSMLLLADAQRGIALQRLDHFDAIADEIFGKGNASDRELGFATAVKKARSTEPES